ncbi:cell division protein FtsB [Thiohalospira halophila DSM 15071]|uniref:Cell division protein FtsB n=1 Tax=Thiohalospira halophila DSM 15071 TaxID=1123397 RepID=A0A1I1P9J1_9GAMM|nr:cell division protein FtsB [Thiohalospira halophila]SFD06611.1 cell division protein FtsB [Thiohalospira halophila DSM 15071]
MRWVAGLLALLLVGLQFRLWSDEGGLPEVWRLEAAVAEQGAANAELAERNRALRAEVEDLKRGLDAIEERARSELGMIREGETFFLLVDDK